MKALVTGAGGQLGRELVRAFEARWDVLPLSREALDVADGRAVREAVAAARPDVVVHAAAMTDVDRCEAAPAEALRVNAVGARNVAVAAEAVGAAVVYVSTDYVFSGEKGAPYDEFDRPDPVQVYGRSKLFGEEAVRAHCPRHHVVRTSWLYGHGSTRNFVAAIRRAAARGRIRVVCDQWGGPTYARDVAQAVVLLAESGLFGTYHVVNGGEASRSEWARRIVAAFCPGVEVEEVPTEAFPTAARRPRRSTLTPLAWRLSGFPELVPWEEAFRRFVREERGG